MFEQHLKCSHNASEWEFTVFAEIATKRNIKKVGRKTNILDIGWCNVHHIARNWLNEIKRIKLIFKMFRKYCMRSKCWSISGQCTLLWHLIELADRRSRSDPSQSFQNQSSNGIKLPKNLTGFTKHSSIFDLVFTYIESWNRAFPPYNRRLRRFRHLLHVI